MKISPITPFRLDAFSFFVKRDELLHPILNGNKARKLAFLTHLAPGEIKFKRLISYGSAQSNALPTLAYLAAHKGFELVFVCHKLPSFLKQNPSGNYSLALNLGAKIIENPYKFIALQEFAFNLCQANDLFIPEGVACKEAKQGLKELASEILGQEWALNAAQRSPNLNCWDKKAFKFDIFLPSGTGTSAVFLAQNLPNHQIYTCACVGDENYLKAQISSLEPSFDFKNLHILNLKQKYTFAKPHKDLLNIYQKALNAGLEFDLLYDTLGLLCVLEHQKDFENPLLYIHQGGLKGNLSQLERYKFKGLLT